MNALGALLVMLSAFSAGSGEDCGCGENARFPEAAAFLSAQGYPPGDYVVLMSWTEAAPEAPGVLVTGYHVQERPTGRVFDLYGDCQGALLDAARLAALGVREKNWDFTPSDVAAEPAAEPAASGAALKTQKPAEPAPVDVVPDVAAALEPLDLDAVLAEDEAEDTKGASRIGVFRTLPEPLAVSAGKASHGAWTVLKDGRRQWSARVQSPEARGMRLHFSECRLPAGARLYVRNMERVEETYGPLAVPEDGGAFWGPTCFGWDVAVICEAPEGTGEASVAVDMIGHIYKGFDALPWKNVAGPCNLDVSCYPEWATVARGVGGIGTVGATGILWCTGTLIVDTNPSTQTPYFLTANHCVNSQYEAQESEVYWLYQTPGCGAWPPHPAVVERTTGADYLAGSAGSGYYGGGNDFTLLRLRSAPPAAVTYVGWSTRHYGLNVPVAAIHHPSGDYKRFSMGTTANKKPHDGQFTEVAYSGGTTEGGSSGCPLLLSSTQQIIGQLWGGLASCLMPDETDFYGRFDLTFPVVAQYLDPAAPATEAAFEVGSASRFEQNSGYQDVVLTVTLNRMPGGEARVTYAASGGTAEAGVDYVAASGQLSFEGTQELSKTITIRVLGDRKDEDDETIVVTLSSPSGCVLGPIASATITLVDDDTDTDGDGLSDQEETEGTHGYVTDPNDADSDDDGITDYEEQILYRGLGIDPNEYTPLCGLSVPFFLDAAGM